MQKPKLTFHSIKTCCANHIPGSTEISLLVETHTEKQEVVTMVIDDDTYTKYVKTPPENDVFVIITNADDASIEIIERIYREIYGGHALTWSVEVFYYEGVEREIQVHWETAGWNLRITKKSAYDTVKRLGEIAAERPNDIHTYVGEGYIRYGGTV